MNDIKFLPEFRVFNSNPINLFVIGDTGFIAKWLISYLFYESRLTRREVNILGFNRSSVNEFKEKTFYYKSTNQEINLSKFLGRDFQVIWGATSTSREQIVTENLKSSWNLLEYLSQKLKENNFSGNILNLSSGACYSEAFSETTPLTERHKTLKVPSYSVLDNYSYLKVGIEKYLDKRFSTKNLRLFSFCGPGMPKGGGYAMDYFFMQSLLQKQIKLQANPDNLRGFMHPLDLAKILVQLLTTQDIPNLLNIGSNIQFTILEWAKMLSKQPVIHNNVVDQPLQHYVPSIDLLQTTINFNPILHTVDMMASTLKYYRNID